MACKCLVSSLTCTQIGVGWDGDFFAVLRKPLGLHVGGFSPGRNVEAPVFQGLLCSWAEQRDYVLELFFSSNKDRRDGVGDLLIGCCRPCQLKVRPEIYVYYQPRWFLITIVAVSHHHIDVFIITWELQVFNKETYKKSEMGLQREKHRERGREDTFGATKSADRRSFTKRSFIAIHFQSSH